jgi:hypothetical protein
MRLLQDGQKDCRLGRSERRPEAYVSLYVEGLSDARTNSVTGASRRAGDGG